MKFWPDDEQKLFFSLTSSNGYTYTPFVVVGGYSWVVSIHAPSSLSATKFIIEGNLSRHLKPGNAGIVSPTMASLRTVNLGSAAGAKIVDPDFNQNWFTIKDQSGFVVSGSAAYTFAEMEVCRFIRIGLSGALTSSASAFFFDDTNFGQS